MRTVLWRSLEGLGVGVGVGGEGLRLGEADISCQHVRALFGNGIAVFVLARIPAGLWLKARVNA